VNSIEKKSIKDFDPFRKNCNIAKQECQVSSPSSLLVLFNTKRDKPDEKIEFMAQYNGSNVSVNKAVMLLSCIVFVKFSSK
jgi:hypothetical protein